MVTLRLLGPAREAAGESRTTLSCTTVAAVIAEAGQRYGADFAAIVAGSRIWVNGESAEAEAEVADGDEVAIVPPVSGGSG